jgi:lipocalin
VLSRTPQLAPELMKAALASASAQGFDLTQLKTTAHTAPP